MIDNKFFNGDDKKLVSCIGALLALDEKGALAPHGIGGHARTLLSASAERIEWMRLEIVALELSRRTWMDEAKALEAKLKARMPAITLAPGEMLQQSPEGWVVVPSDARRCAKPNGTIQVSNVRQLPGVAINESEPVPGTIELLESLLVMAKEGTLRSVAVAFTKHERQIVTDWHSNNEFFTLIGGVAWLQKRMLDGSDIEE